MRWFNKKEPKPKTKSQLFFEFSKLNGWVFVSEYPFYTVVWFSTKAEKKYKNLIEKELKEEELKRVKQITKWEKENNA
jgi:hypothetical protein